MTCVMPKSMSSTTVARWNVGEPSSRQSITPSNRCGSAASLRRRQVALGALALPHRPVVPLDAEPAQVLDDRLLSARDVARGVGVVDAQQEPVSEAAVRDGAQRVADVQRPGRARSEPDAHHQSVAAASSKWSTYCVEWRPGTRSAAAVHTTRKQVDNTNESVNPVTVG